MVCAYSAANWDSEGASPGFAKKLRTKSRIKYDSNKSLTRRKKYVPPNPMIRSCVQKKRECTPVDCSFVLVARGSMLACDVTRISAASLDV